MRHFRFKVKEAEVDAENVLRDVQSEPTPDHIGFGSALAKTTPQPAKVQAPLTPSYYPEAKEAQ
jgi:hypothetical protein